MTEDAPSEAAREALRREHGVRLVTAVEEGFAAAHLPGGVYGFTSSPALESPLFAVRHYRNFEIHRLTNGSTALVGFVTPGDASQLTRAVGPDAVTVVVHPDLEGDATVIVSIAYDRVAQHRQYAVRNAAAITLQVRPTGSTVAV
jgi:hypothetical protein